MCSKAAQLLCALHVGCADVCAGHRAAIRHVLYPSSACERHEDEMQHKPVIKMLHRVHRMWFSRIKELLVNNFWAPGHDGAISSQLFTFRRVLHCRPSAVYYAGGNDSLIRPCKHHRFCPFCWGRVGALCYRRFRQRVRTAQKLKGDLILVSRALTYTLPAPTPLTEMTEPEFITAGAAALRKALEQQKQECTALAKQLQRNTEGSAWRIVVDPQDDGWAIEIRQLLLAQPKKRLPLVQRREAKSAYYISTKLTNDDRVEEAIGRFIQYPSGLLTAPVAVTAAYLHASYALRLASGTGSLRACSQGLARAFSTDKKHGDPQAEKSSPES